MSTPPLPSPCCLVCGRSHEEVPLIALHHRSSDVWICPQHLPILIHHPEQLVGKLPGAESLKPTEEH